MKITKMAYNTIIACTKHHSYREDMSLSPIYILGAQNGIIQNIFPIKVTSGCRWMAKIDTKNMAKTIIKVIKSGLQPYGILQYFIVNSSIRHIYISRFPSENIIITTYNQDKNKKRKFNLLALHKNRKVQLRILS